MENTESIELTVKKYVKLAMLSCEMLQDGDVKVLKDTTDGLFVRFAKRLWMHELEAVERTVTYPKTWWDAFKERFFPCWAVRRWPCEYAEVVVRLKRYAAFPELHYPDAFGKHVIKTIAAVAGPDD